MPIFIPMHSSGCGGDVPASFVVYSVLGILAAIAFLFGVAVGAQDSDWSSFDPVPAPAALVFFPFPIGYVIGWYLFRPWGRR